MADDQHTTGRTSSCCVGMRMSLSCGYIIRGFLWHKYDPPLWIPWTFNISGQGFREVAPIHFCPFCGIDLDSE